MSRNLVSNRTSTFQKNGSFATYRTRAMRSHGASTWLRWNRDGHHEIFEEKKCSFIEMYHWNMSLRYHDIVLHLKNLQNPPSWWKNIFKFLVVYIDNRNIQRLFRKKNSGPSSNASIFYIWSFSCFRFFGFFMLVQILAQVHRFKVSITSISNGGWNPAIGRREISIFVQPSFFLKTALGTTIHSVAGTLVGNNVHSLSAFLDFNEIFPWK